MMPSIIDLLFGCVHADYSWPQTKGGLTTVSCLECGKTFFYDLNRMAIQEPAPRVITHMPPSFIEETIELCGREERA